MILDDVIDILDSSRVVQGYDVRDDGVRFWIFTGAYKKSRQGVVDDIEDIDGINLSNEGVRNDWYWYFVTSA